MRILIADDSIVSRHLLDATLRKWGYEVKGVPNGRAEIVVCADNFHGRTLGIIGFSTDVAAREHFGPFAPGFKIIPFGDAKALEDAITPNTVAFLVEPIQGEAGVIIPPPGYFTKVRELCTEHDVMLVLDEIQTGLGRTGKFSAHDWFGAAPDIMTVAKALSSAYLPISATIISDEIAAHQPKPSSESYGKPMRMSIVPRFA